jgi:alkanesulfonate monooxygenase SsuD/methylene tetrahydromethanopterin reductase-like flavin-dependent oxidoreductase (luciferase family)
LVACASYWNPVVLARAAADIDRLSDGRFVLGVGSGDMPGEFAQMGIDWKPAPERQATLNEALQIIRPLLRRETVTFVGERFRADGAVLAPPPVQQPHVPLLIAGGGERTTLRYVAEYGDVSNVSAVSWAGGAFQQEDLRRKCAVLDGHCAEVGRPADAVLRTGLLCTFLSDSRPALEAKLSAVPPLLDFFDRLLVIGRPEDAVTRVQALLDAGMQYVIFIVLPFDRETLQLLAERVLPAIDQSPRLRHAREMSAVG